ncbi:MAG: hypothetical protein K0R68_2179 [Mycobacterium sp.]|nr:hypothetical protein [Mycobacterium sp.]
MYYLFILAVGAERLIELVVSRRNARWSMAHGGKEFGRGHYPVMVAMHALLLISCVVEVAVFHRPFIPWLGWLMVAVVITSTGTTPTTPRWPPRWPPCRWCTQHG